MKRLVALMICAVSLGAAAQIPDYVPNDGLVAWWNFDDGSSVEELSLAPGVSYGTVPAATRFGADFSAIQFEGDIDSLHRIEVDPSILSSITSSFSASVFFKRDLSCPNCEQRQGLFGTPQALFNEGGYYLRLLSDQLDFAIGVPYTELFEQGTTIDTNWHHVVTTYDGSLMRLFLDGELESEASVSDVILNDWLPSGKPFLIGVEGMAYGDPFGPFNGSLDDLGFWNRALSEFEVLALYSSEVLLYGCTDLEACNFNSDAVVDDGSCVSCDVLALACGTGTIWDPISQTCIADESACGWQPDGNGDNLVGVNDLLDLLGVYGDTDYDQDGIWDSADDCVGEYDECGVCNGSGPSIPIIESIEILYDSVYAEPIDEWLVFEVGADTTFFLVCEVIEGCTNENAFNFDSAANSDDGSCILNWYCGLPFTYDGKEYSTAHIADACWFAENLSTAIFLNGDSIPTGLSEEEWASTSDNVLPALVSSGAESYYNHYVVSDPRELCPSGWRVPGMTDWDELSQVLGGSPVAGRELKSDVDWDGTNSAGFTALPLGQAYDNTGVVIETGWRAIFWTSQGSGGYAPAICLESTVDALIQHGSADRRSGFSVRCIKDTE